MVSAVVVTVRIDGRRRFFFFKEEIFVWPPCNNAGAEVRAWLEQEAPARVHHLSGGLAQCAWLRVAAPRAAAPIAEAGSPRHPIPLRTVVVCLTRVLPGSLWPGVPE